MTEFIAHLEGAEGIVNHMYLDTAREPNVTIGIGTNLTDDGGADAAVRLLLGHATVRATGADATEQEIRDDFAAVAARPGGNFAAAHYEQFTALDIDDATARQLAEDYVRERVAALVAGDDFPEFDRTPANAQKGLMDLLYNLGLDGLVGTFTKFSSAYNGRDWKTCSRQVFRRTVSDTRDNAVSRWFEDLADGHQFFILGAVRSGSGFSIADFDETTPKFSPVLSR
jgi:GH24 family phage-related lysozyme (muramidase)